MGYENLIKISSMVRSIYDNIEETNAKIVNDDNDSLNENIQKLNDDLSSFTKIFENENN